MLFIVEGKTEKKSADLFVVATLAAGYRRYSQRRRRHTQQLSFRRQKFKNFFLPCAPLCFVSLRKYNNAFLGVLVACAKFFFSSLVRFFLLSVFFSAFVTSLTLFVRYSVLNAQPKKIVIFGEEKYQMYVCSSRNLQYD